MSSVYSHSPHSPPEPEEYYSDAIQCIYTEEPRQQSTTTEVCTTLDVVGEYVHTGIIAETLHFVHLYS